MTTGKRCCCDEPTPNPCHGAGAGWECPPAGSGDKQSCWYTQDGFPDGYHACINGTDPIDLQITGQTWLWAEWTYKPCYGSPAGGTWNFGNQAARCYRQVTDACGLDCDERPPDDKYGILGTCETDQLGETCLGSGGWANYCQQRCSHTDDSFECDRWVCHRPARGVFPCDCWSGITVPSTGCTPDPDYDRVLHSWSLGTNSETGEQWKFDRIETHTPGNYNWHVFTSDSPLRLVTISDLYDSSECGPELSEWAAVIREGAPEDTRWVGTCNDYRNDTTSVTDSGKAEYSPGHWPSFKIRTHGELWLAGWTIDVAYQMARVFLGYEVFEFDSETESYVSTGVVYPTGAEPHGDLATAGCLAWARSVIYPEPDAGDGGDVLCHCGEAAMAQDPSGYQSNAATYYAQGLPSDDDSNTDQLATFRAGIAVDSDGNKTMSACHEYCDESGSFGGDCTDPCTNTDPISDVITYTDAHAPAEQGECLFDEESKIEVYVGLTNLVLTVA